MKKFVAILCSITLALSTMPVYGEVIIDGDVGDGDVCENPWAELFTTKAGETTPAETTTKPGVYNPGFNPADLEYKTVTCNGMPELTLGFAVQSGTIEGIDPWYGDGGNTFQMAFDGAAGEVTEVTVNGVAASEDVVPLRGQGLVKVNPTKFAENTYSVIVVKTANGGEFTAVIKKGSPNPGDYGDPATTPAETTTTSENNETTTPGGDDETTTSKTPGFDFDVTALDYTEVKCEADESKILNVAVYGEAPVGYEPWYGDGGNTLALRFSADAGMVSKVTINGQEADDVVTEVNKGIVKINPTKLEADSYSVIEVATESGVYTFVVKNGKPVDPPTIETTTPSNPGTDVTTPSESGTDETTPSNPGTDVTTPSESGTDETTTPDTPIFDFDVTALDYTEVKCEADESKILNLAVYGEAPVGYEPWYGDGGNTLAFRFSADAGMVSKVTINGQEADDVVTEVNKGIVKINPTKLEADSYSVIEVTTESGVYTFVVKNGKPVDPPINETTPSNPGTDVTTPSDPGTDVTTPSDPGTDATTPSDPETDETTPSDPETDATTPSNPGTDVTTPSNPGTDATTPSNGGNNVTTPSNGGGNNTTTVAPTTTKTSAVVNVSVAKTMVKKVAKKLASKQAKISLKKIAGAKYQVKVSTTKKFKKKNTVTKKASKATVKVSNKKLLNKKVLYVKARAYKVVGGKTYYGKWSKIKKVKIKK